MKEIKEKLNKWRHISCTWVERFNVVKMLILHSWTQLNSNQNPSKLAHNDKLILNFMWRDKSQHNTKDAKQI